MIKSKMVIGVGLVLGLATGVCLANSLGGSPGEVNQDTPFTLDLTNKLDMAPGKYYTVTCQLDNVHSSKSVKARVELKYGSLSPVSMNGQPVHNAPESLRAYEAALQDRVNTLVLEHVHPGAFTGTKTVEVTKTHMVDKEVTVQQPCKWYQWCKTKDVTTTQQVEESYMDHDQVPATYYDQLIFSASDSAARHLGSGYKLVDCDAKEEGASAPVAVDQPAVSSTDVSPPTDVAPSTDGTASL